MWPFVVFAIKTQKLCVVKLWPVPEDLFYVQIEILGSVHADCDVLKHRIVSSRPSDQNELTAETQIKSEATIAFQVWIYSVLDICIEV